MNPEDRTRMAKLMKEAVDQFMEITSLAYHSTGTHQGKVDYEEWLRYCVTTSLVPDLMAIACGIENLAQGETVTETESIIKESADTTILEREFVEKMMTRVPDSERMQRIAEHAESMGEKAAATFKLCLWQTLLTPEEQYRAETEDS